MAVNFTTNLPTTRNVGTVINPQGGVNEVARQKVQEQNQNLQEQKVQELQHTQVIRSDDKVIEALDLQRQQEDRQRTTLDSPDRPTKKALNAYNSVANADKKEQLQSLLGVDLYV